MKLITKNAIYNCMLVKDYYRDNGRLYLGLYDLDTQEPIVDITENHPELTDEQLMITADGQKVVIDNDFLNCFDSVRDCKSWCMDNLNCLGWGEVEWYPCLYVLNHKEN